jgi:hypothetical protein
MPKPEDLVYIDGSLRYPVKVKLGEDELLFLLKKDDELRTYLDGLEKRSLDTPTFIEVRPSPLGGLGLFTTKDCLPGDLLLSERPMVSAILNHHSIGRIDMLQSQVLLADDGPSPGEINVFESFMETVTERCLSRINKARFMSLAASIPLPPNVQAQRFSIFFTNAIVYLLPASSPSRDQVYAYVRICQLLVALGNSY